MQEPSHKEDRKAGDHRKIGLSSFGSVALSLPGMRSEIFRLRAIRNITVREALGIRRGRAELNEEPITTLLSMVAFELVVSRNLPKNRPRNLARRGLPGQLHFLRGLHRRDSVCFYFTTERTARCGGAIAPFRPLGLSAGVFFALGVLAAYFLQ
jgi:hypothetical protein